MRILFCIFLLAFSIQGGADAKSVVQEMLALADVQVNGNRPWDIQIHDERFYERVLSDRSMGFGESYMEGWWDAQNLDQCIYKILSAKLETKTKPTWGMLLAYLKAKFFNMQSKSKSRQVIAEHYELGNELYEPMLGSTMAYTCAYWKNCATLEEAQKAKFDLIAKKMQLKPGMKVLDLGCGWGGFAKHIAENYGVEVVAVNLSKVQCDYAKGICKNLPVEVRNQDYRDATGLYDRVISIGLMEHVGVKNYRGFLELIHRSLKDGGIALIHTIGRNDSAITADAWISKYIFPHGHLPSIAQFGAAMEGLFVMEDWHNIGINYDATLMAWFQNFDKSWDKLKANYTDPFYRMWKFYLLGCAAAFRCRDIQLWQVVLSKEGVSGGYESIR